MEKKKIEQVWTGLKFLETEAALMKGRADLCAGHDMIYAMVDCGTNEIPDHKISEVQKCMTEEYGWMVDEENTMCGTLAFNIFV